MLDYILKEKEINLNILKNKDRFPGKLFRKKVYRDVVIYATGSSSNAAWAAQLYMEKNLGIPVYIKEPSIALNYEKTWNEDSLYLAISQGGSSASTISLVEQFEKRNIEIYTVTSNLKSPIAQKSNNILDIGMGIETVPYVTAGYTAIILLLWLISLDLAKNWGKLEEEDYCRELSKIEDTIFLADSVIHQTNEWFKVYKEEFIRKDRFVFISYGAGYGTALEAETKFMEILHKPAHGHELEEYMHGPYLGLGRNDLLILLDPNGKLKDRMKLLRKFLDRHMDKTYLITSSHTGEQTQDLSLELNIDELLSPLLLTIPIHLLTYYLSVEKGINLDESYYPEFDDITGSKIY